MSKLNVFLYHMCYPDCVGNMKEGYIGITSRPEERFKEHKKYHNVIQNSEDIVFNLISMGSREEMLEMEKWLRPKVNMGWNKAIGGGGVKYYKTENFVIFEKTCPICGKIFKTYPSVDQKTCSADCGHTYQTKDKTRKCPVCGENFKYKHNKQVCCSHLCGMRFSGRYNNDIECSVCRKLFHPKRKTTKTCCKKCLCVLRSINAKNRKV